MIDLAAAAVASSPEARFERCHLLELSPAGLVFELCYFLPTRQAVQAAASQQIKRLEEVLDCKLFERVGRGLVLAPAGERLLSQARQLVGQNDALLASMRTPPFEGEVRFGVPYDIIGSFVPATRAVIGPLDRIFTRIGAGDDLAGGRSTFMVEMTETANILHNATPRSLVLMDEIGRGTSTFDGLSLAWAVARELALKVRAFTLFATHYFELTSLAQEIPACANAHLDATEHADSLIFLHAVKPGPANRKIGRAHV